MQKGLIYILSSDLGRAYSKGPDTALRPFQFVQQLRVVRLKVWVDYNADSRVVGVVGHGYRSPAQDGDFLDIFHLNHGVQNAGADKSGGAGKDDMHCDAREIGGE